MKNIKDTLEHWYYWYIKPISYWPKEVKRGVGNLVYYFKVIWKQRDFDHGYIEELWLAKFKRQYKHYLSDKVVGYVGMKKDVQGLKICIDILERRRSDWYTNQWYDNPKREDPSQDVRSELLTLTFNTEARDWKIFCDILNKYFPKWWD